MDDTLQKTSKKREKKVNIVCPRCNQNVTIKLINFCNQKCPKCTQRMDKENGKRYGRCKFLALFACLWIFQTLMCVCPFISIQLNISTKIYCLVAFGLAALLYIMIQIILMYNAHKLSDK